MKEFPLLATEEAGVPAALLATADMEEAAIPVHTAPVVVRETVWILVFTHVELVKVYSLFQEFHCVFSDPKHVSHSKSQLIQLKLSANVLLGHDLTATPL